MTISNRSTEKEQFWRLALDEQRRSGISAKAFCQQQGLSVPSFYAWRRKIQQREERSAIADRGDQHRLVPVTVVAAGRRGATANASPHAGRIEIVTPDGFTLRVDRSAGATEITELLRAILSCQSRTASC